VTLRTTPVLITRQRQNLGQTRSLGLELDGETLVGRYLRFSFGYAFTDATVRSFSANPGLVGNLVPQVPKQQLTLEARFANPHLLEAVLLARVSSAQFDDDQNQYPLAGYFTLDAQLSRRLGPRVQVFAAFENVTGHRYPVGATPVETFGPPFLVRGGFRYDWSRAP
jgi:outer membrane receptor protein involved in Fe transport